MRKFKNVFESIICNAEDSKLKSLREFCRSRSNANEVTLDAIENELRKRNEKPYSRN